MDELQLLRLMYLAGFIGTFIVSFMQLRRKSNWFLKVETWRDWNRYQMWLYFCRTSVIAIVPGLNIASVVIFILMDMPIAIYRSGMRKLIKSPRFCRWFFEDKPYRLREGS